MIEDLFFLEKEIFYKSNYMSCLKQFSIHFLFQMYLFYNSELVFITNI
jgi:hypothetical protein